MHRWRFVMAYAALGLLAAGIATATVKSVLRGDLHRVKRVPPTPALSYASKLEGTLNQYASEHGLPRVLRVDCVKGTGEARFCAFVYQGLCRGAIVDDSTGEYVTKKAGKVGLPAESCTARAALKWIGSQPA